MRLIKPFEDSKVFCPGMKDEEEDFRICTFYYNDEGECFRCLECGEIDYEW